MAVKNRWRSGCRSKKIGERAGVFALEQNTHERVWQQKSDDEWGVALKNNKKQKACVILGARVCEGSHLVLRDARVEQQQ